MLIFAHKNVKIPNFTLIKMLSMDKTRARIKRGE